MAAAVEVLPPGAAEALQDAAAESSEAFRATLRQLIAAAPTRKDAILRHALTEHPQRAAELLLAGLYQPLLLPPDTGGDHTTNRTAALPRAQTTQVDDVAEAIEEEGPWNGTVTLGATVRTGNTDNAGATSEVTVAYEEGPWRHQGKVSLDYLRDRARTLEQAFVGEYEARYELDPRTISYGLARYEDDRFSGFDYEFTGSVGLGRHIIQEPARQWTVTLGPSLRLAEPADSDEQIRAVGVRFTNLLSWQLSDTAELRNETEALADTERMRVNNDVVLKLRIIDELSGQISFGFVYRSDTPEDAETIDTTTRAAVVYDF